MFIQAYKSAFKVLGRKPLALFGYELLASLIALIIGYYAFSLPLPSIEMILEGDLDYYFHNLQYNLTAVKGGIYSLIPLGIGFLLTVGMSRVYLASLEGKDPDADNFLTGFKNIKRSLGGMIWQFIWNIVWPVVALIAFLLVFFIFFLMGSALSSSLMMISDNWKMWEIAGTLQLVITIIGAVLALLVMLPILVLATIKKYSYAFVPHILATRPDVTPTQALKLSMEIARGKKLHMFLADLIVYAAVFVTTLIVVGLCLVPFANVIFGVIAFLYVIIVAFACSLFSGLYTAEFYRLKVTPKASRVPDPADFVANVVNQQANTNQN